MWDVEQPPISSPHGDGSLDRILPPRLEFSRVFLAVELRCNPLSTQRSEFYNFTFNMTGYVEFSKEITLYSSITGCVEFSIERLSSRLWKSTSFWWFSQSRTAWFT